MAFAVTEEDYIRFYNESGSKGTFLDCAYMGRTFAEVITAIKFDELDWFKENGKVEEPQYWCVFDDNVRRKVLIEHEPFISVKWSIEEEWLA